MASLKRDRSGNWIIRFWTGGRGSRLVYQNLGNLTYKDALTAAGKVRAKWAHRSATADPSLTFANLAETYLEMEGPRHSERGRALLETVLRCHLKPFFGEMRVENMRGLDVDRYRLQRRQLKRVKGVLKGEKEPARVPTDRPVSPSTLNREWSILRTILNWAESKELVDRNPIRRRAVKMLDVAPRVVFFEPVEWGAFVAAAEADAELRAIVPALRFALLTGSRPGEVMDLQWKDVDLERSVLTIRQKKTKGLPKYQHIGPEVDVILRAQVRGIGEAKVFGLELAFYQTTFDRVARAAKLERGEHGDLIPYATRHTAATWLDRGGLDLAAVEAVLGHQPKGKSVTLGYVHTSPREAAEKTRKALEVLAAAEAAALLLRERTVNETSAAPAAGISGTASAVRS